VLVAISARWDTLALAAADSAELQAPVLHPCLRAPLRALGGTET